MKLTREEAVEMLKNRKVHVKDAQESEAVQRKLFECGFRWWPDCSVSVRETDKPYLFTWNDMEIVCASIEYAFNLNSKTEISAEEIKAIEIVDEPKTSQQELNLCEILKDCPKGTKFYCSIYGYVTFNGIVKDDPHPIKFTTSIGLTESVTSEGWDFKDYSEDCECIFFPSKEQRDWGKWICPKPDLPVDTPMMVSSDKKDWWLRYYAGGKKCWMSAYKSKDMGIRIQWNHIIPFDKFNPNDIEESLKHDICKK